jgi:hypothetical protein
MSHRLFSSRPARYFLVFLFLTGSVFETLAAELKVEAKLIWATNDDKSPDPKHTPVDPAMAEKLRKVFKWKNYFVVNRMAKVIPSRGSNRFELSKKCTIDITELEGPRVEVKLIGEGKPVHKIVKQLSKGESFIYSGDDKNESAWFVIITDLEEKQAAK